MTGVPLVRFFTFFQKWAVSAWQALLYLVPCTVIPFLLLAWRRGEVGVVWKGSDESTAEGSSYHEPGVRIVGAPRTMRGGQIELPVALAPLQFASTVRLEEVNTGHEHTGNSDAPYNLKVSVAVTRAKIMTGSSPLHFSRCNRQRIRKCKT